jgi:hypothetical protein
MKLLLHATGSIDDKYDALDLVQVIRWGQGGRCLGLSSCWQASPVKALLHKAHNRMAITKAISNELFSQRGESYRYAV